MEDYKKMLGLIGCGAAVLIVVVFAAIWVGFHRGEQANLQTGPAPLCANVPESYRTIFDAAGRKFNVQPAFIAAIFYAGEHGNSWPDSNGPWATSPKEAQGPFQFMPDTWNAYKQDGNGDGVMDVQNLWDAAFGAANYLAHLGAGDNTTDLDKLRNAAGRYNGGNNWEGKPESTKYVARVIPAFQKFYCAAIATTECAKKVVELALGAVGHKNTEYLPEDPNHACAAFTTTILKQAGAISKTYTAVDDFWNNGGGEIVIPKGGKLDLSLLQPGDAVFFIKTYKSEHYFTHVGIYVGNDRLINTSSQKGLVDNDSLTSYDKTAGPVAGAKRFCK